MQQRPGKRKLESKKLKKMTRDLPQFQQQRRHLLRLLGAAASVAVTGAIAGCGGDSSGASGAGGTADNTDNPTNPGSTNTTTPSNPSPTNPQPTVSGPVTIASINVSANVAAAFPAQFTGLSCEKMRISTQLFASADSNAINLYKLLGPSLLRIGGNSVDTTTWTPGGAGQTSGQVAPSDIDALASFIQTTGWKILYGVNLAQSSPSAAAAEVAYAANAFGSALAGIEIGNEPNDYGKYFPNGWSPSDYISRWQSFASAILQAVPSVRLTGPATSAAGYSKYFPPFVQAEASQLSLLTQHYYRGSATASTATVDTLLSYPDTNLQALIAELVQQSQSSGVPTRMAETNSFSGGGASGVSNSYASALWLIDHTMTCALGGLSGVNFHGTNDSSSSYTQMVIDSTGMVTAINPEFYGLKLLSMAGSGSLLTTSASANGLNVSAYAIQSAAGAISILLLNKEPSQNLAATVVLPSAARSASAQVMQGPKLSDTANPLIQGASIGVDGSFSPGAAYTLTVNGKQVSVSVPAASAVLVAVS
ncbi:glycosyl hydrolase family 79 C-terminal domain-containing protein [Burkholderia pyrrocinia]|uniref:glycosyl hydrolase family 79 C-terminal domain-containing protein n=1 Tax=Burkholderia pyrrocinia TaxID=60550 RepID=UPI001589B5D4|nr:glycosyl hydrolase family 79 C-terminal domain-containing protein [Burkholderia pyrrocinia]